MDNDRNCNDIAVIGMSCRVSGANSPSELWDMLASSKDTRQEIDRFNSAGFYSAKCGDQNGLTNVRHAYLLQDGIDKFDHSFFDISSTEAAAMDPQHRILLEVAYEAFEKAGISVEKLAGSNTAVYLGVSGSDYATSLQRDIDTLPKYHSTGSSVAICANRISHQFDLRGPSMVIDTACSSSATALHQALLALKAGDCSMALVGASNLILNPDTFVHLSSLGFLSPEGICHSFDSAADGYARGEGVLSVLLKPLPQAVKDGDPIRSIILGSAINQDGHTNGITLPSATRQKENMEMVYSKFGIDPAGIQYFEAHGTGTAVGDPLELSAITKTFGKSKRKHRLVIGSAKASVGHLEAGAALVGIIKTIECLERGMIPPQKHFSILNPKINSSHVQIPTSLLLWPDTGGFPRRAAVNSFGFGGTNCHIVLEHMPSQDIATIVIGNPYVFKVSAASESSLQLLARRYASYVSSNLPNLQSLAYTTLTRRSTLAKTQYIVASNHEELVKKLSNSTESQIWKKATLSDPMGFIFTGQGAQWYAMGATLLESSEIFQSVIDQCDRVLQSLPDKPEWKLRKELTQQLEHSSINMPVVAQTACTALQIGLVEIWKSWGIVPRFVIGHSSGEIAACYAAGGYSLQETILIAYYRGKYVQEYVSSDPESGAMCAVGLSEIDCVELLRGIMGYATIAAVNSPLNCTLSGDKSTIQDVQTECERRHIFCRKLRVDVAYHSLHMKVVAIDYKKSLDAVLGGAHCKKAEFTCDVFSTVLERPLSPMDLSSEYWVANLCSTVRFSSTLSASIKAYTCVSLVEIGPHPALKTPVNDIMSHHRSTKFHYFHSGKRNTSSFRSMLESAVEMMASGVEIDMSTLNSCKGEIEYKGGQRVLTDLPSYTWDHTKSHWGESRASRELRFREFPSHPILGWRDFGDNPHQMLWRNCPKAEKIPGIEDALHMFEYSASPAFCILMALEATSQVKKTRKLEKNNVYLKDIRFHSLLPLGAIGTGNLETCLSLIKDDESDNYTLTISALVGVPDESWKLCCSGKAQFVEGSPLSHEVKVPLVNDANKLQYIRNLGLFELHTFDDINIEKDKVAGYLNVSAQPLQPYDQFVRMATVLQIPELQMVSCGPVARHLVQHISSLQILPLEDDTQIGHVNSKHARLSTVRSTTSITYNMSPGVCAMFNGIHTKAHENVQLQPPLQSLFYVPRLLPDISCLDESRTMHVKYLFELISHKWPMCDIGLGEIPQEELKCIQIAINGLMTHERQNFRSVNSINSASPTLGGTKYHIIFGTGSWTSSHLSSIDVSNLSGLACVQQSSQGDGELFSRLYDTICQVTGISDVNWVLGRRKSLEEASNDKQDVHLQVFMPKTMGEIQNVERSNAKIVMLGDTGGINECVDSPSYGSHIIVLDCEDISLLVDDAKSNFLYWFQPLLANLKILVWVTTRTSSTPFGDVASSFIKTLLSEYPLLRATNLIIEDILAPDAMLDLGIDAHAKLLAGRKETEITIRESQTWITRYRHDDNLSASVGLQPPRISNYGRVGQFWEVIQAPAQRVAIRGDKRPKITMENVGMISIDITSSVIDHLDVVLVQDSVRLRGTEQRLGHFFSGIVNHSQDPIFLPSQRVVGWHNGAHCSHINISTSQVHKIPNEADTDIATAQYAAYSLALALIEGAARARDDEMVSIQIQGILGEALYRLCADMSINTCEEASNDCNFIIRFDINLGFSLNGRSIDITKYLESARIHRLIKQYLTPRYALFSELTTFGISEAQGAFEHAKSKPGNTILVRDDDQALDFWVSETPPVDLFKSDAIYILVGGLGGLGRHFMRWMIARGAKHIVTFSRRGMKSPGAEEAISQTAQLGANLEVFTVDACDRDAVDSALSRVRLSRPIRGYFNLSIRLEAYPLSSMTPEQWQIAVQTKVQSSWNLHQASLDDDLDMFIMFSSIASIAGSRTQANYAVGNSFQNSLARYRKLSLGLPGLSIALGAIKEAGILAGEDQLMKTLVNTGLHCYNLDDFDKIIEAAILESYSQGRPVIGTGLERFRIVEGEIIANSKQNQIFWSDWPEFGHFFDYEQPGLVSPKEKTLVERIEDSYEHKDEQYLIIYEAFSECLGDVLGRDMEGLDSNMSVAALGLDSLNTITCRYWFFKILHVDVPVFEILACKSIRDLLTRVLSKIKAQSASSKNETIPEPVHHNKTLKYRPISHSQKRMWFLHHYLEDKTVNNLLLESEVIGEIDTQVFSQAWTIFIQRHESLHSQIVDTPQGLQQFPIQNHCFPFSVAEASSEGFEKKCDEVRLALRSHVYDIEAGNLVQGQIVRSSNKEARFFLASHHIAWDRASVRTIFDETAKIYKAIRNGEDPFQLLDPNPYQFIDYTIWQNRILEQAGFMEPHLKYWTKQLANLPTSVSLLPASRVKKRPEVKTYIFDEVEVALDQKVTNGIHRFCQDNSITPFMLVTSTLTLLVSRLTGDKDITIGIADSDRGHSAFDDLVGFTVNLLAIRARLDKNDTLYCDFLERYRETCLKAYQHRALPFDILLQKLNIPRSLSNNQVFQIVVNYQTAGGFKDCDYGDFKLTNYSHYNARPQSDFRLDVEEISTGEMRCLWTYDVSLYSKETMVQVVECFRLLVNDILLRNPQTKLCDFAIPEIQSVPTGLEQYTEHNGILTSEPSDPFTTLFDRAVLKHPDKIAIIDNSNYMTYQDLDIYTGRIAKYLQAERLEPGTRIGICCTTTTRMAIAIYGVVRAGLTYVPIDTHLPEERISTIIKDSEIRMLLIGGVDMSQVTNLGVEHSQIQQIEQLMSKETGSFILLQHESVVPRHGFCCIFTSGTTGRPKGIVVGHRQLRCQMQSYHDFLGTDSSDIMLLASSAIFDMSLTSIYGSILRGATLVISSQELRYSPPELITFAIENQVTNCAITTTQLKFLLSVDSSQLAKWTSLKSLVVGGEEVPPWVASDFYALGLPNAVLYNGYGPTETTVCNALNRIGPSDCSAEVVSIGKPLFPATFRILDERLNNVVQGNIGELYIGGDVLNDGYVNQQELTAAAFIEISTRQSTSSDSSPAKCYRTRDLARMADDGRYFILGRVNGDRQVKIRGIRTELGEIESAIYQALKALDKAMFGISLLAVVYHQGETLVAYLMADEKYIQAVIGEQLLLSSLRFKLKDILPIHMIPSQILIVSCIPQTPTGKICYKSLQTLSHGRNVGVEQNKGLYKIEEKQNLRIRVAEIWKDLLAMESEPSVEDDFFSLGGHSLMLLSVQREVLQRFQIRIPLVDIFTNSSLHSLTNLISSKIIEARRSSVIGKEIPYAGSGSETTFTPMSACVEDRIDWAHEARLPTQILNRGYRSHPKPKNWPISKGIILVGAGTMAGSHLLSHLLTNVSGKIYCIGMDCSNSPGSDPKSRVVQELDHWGLPHHDLERVFAYRGSLSHETLGLSQEQVSMLSTEVGSIYNMDSEVSLLKSYEDLRLSNVESLRFLVSLACRDQTKPPMEIHYLSTWGVPHLQAWSDTKLSSNDFVKGEFEMNHMEPSSDGSLGYLKARWVCEKLLCEAARVGLPVTIYRSSMCGSSQLSNTPLHRGDINRRILEGILQTGLVPDFRSAEGGGMSWISASFLVQSICFFAQKERRHLNEAQFYHIVAEEHIPYTALARLLKTSHQGRSLTTVEPSDWFEALRCSGNEDMVMHAEVLEAWVNAGWLPFQMEAKSTLAQLRLNGIVPPDITKEYLMRHVIGDMGF
ncbi:hypothetical protein HYFRA_00002991 [Hymenoscyphus fraxineus]|uniref:Polyketide synthase n=1 Tax=Hymenoscyphus fraxineus TaxID=746836 RepID=A0A9N9KPL6_9HELO|nr:hypothetical protein HYFRA_00002991 [Hymenoscyphus fraxineus]